MSLETNSSFSSRTTTSGRPKSAILNGDPVQAHAHRHHKCRLPKDLISAMSPMSPVKTHSPQKSQSQRRRSSAKKLGPPRPSSSHPALATETKSGIKSKYRLGIMDIMFSLKENVLL